MSRWKRLLSRLGLCKEHERSPPPEPKSKDPTPLPYRTPAEPEVAADLLPPLPSKEEEFMDAPTGGNLTTEVKAKIKRRAKRAFGAIDEGTVPSKVRQHKLRRASEDGKILYFDWRGGSHGKRGPFFAARRDKLNRVYVTEIEALPAQDHAKVHCSPTTGARTV